MTVTIRNLEKFKALASEIRAIAVQWEARIVPFLPPRHHVIGSGRDPADPYTDDTVHAEIQAITLAASVEMLRKDLDNYLAGLGFDGKPRRPQKIEWEGGPGS